MFKQNPFNYLWVSLLLAFAFTVHAASVDPLLHHAGDPVLGNPDGAVTVVEFFDYQCGHCGKMAPVMAEVIKANPTIRFVFKDYPILGELSRYAARAAIAASYQGKYEELNHALFVQRLSSKEAILNIAKTTGLDIKQLKKDMQSKKVSNQIKSNIKLARELKINGTPSFIIGKTNASNREWIQVLGEMSSVDLQKAIDKTKAS